MKWKFKTLVAYFLFVAALQSFAQVEEEHVTVVERNERGYYSQIFGYTVKEVFNPPLFNLIENWLNTPYRYSGKTEEGIDCSGFVNMALRTLTGETIGCSSGDMYNRCKHIGKEKLRPGDLVFFKTRGKRVSHVGIYLGEDHFVHASTTNGVIISNLNEKYYARHFAKGGRVNLLNERAEK
jgi:lipoprotein Spr